MRSATETAKPTDIGVWGAEHAVGRAGRPAALIPIWKFKVLRRTRIIG